MMAAALIRIASRKSSPTRTTAVWKAVEKACLTGDFRPKEGPLCKSCSFQPWCPAFGGNPELAAELRGPGTVIEPTLPLAGAVN